MIGYKLCNGTAQAQVMKLVSYAPAQGLGYFMLRYRFFLFSLVCTSLQACGISRMLDHIALHTNRCSIHSDKSIWHRDGNCFYRVV